MTNSKDKKNKIRDTRLGGWLKDKAPKVLDIVGDLLPDQGALGVVKNFWTKSLGLTLPKPKL